MKFGTQPNKYIFRFLEIKYLILGIFVKKLKMHRFA